MDYNNDIVIDESALDVEWLEQPRLMLRYCKYASQCRQDMDLAKESVDVQKARLDQEIRSNPERFDIGKITEAVVQNAILTDPDYQSKMKEYIEAKYEFEVAQSAVRAFEQRKSALENLVRLHGMSYFAGPSVPRDLTQERHKEERNESANKKVTIKRRK